MEDSIFTKIVKKEIPAHIVYEDERTLAFLDIHPKLEGHILVISKSQVEFVWDLDDQDYPAVMETVKKVALRLREVTGKPYIHTSVVGTDVPHAHVHVIPFSVSSELHGPQDMSKDPDHEALAAFAETLRF